MARLKGCSEEVKRDSEEGMDDIKGRTSGGWQRKGVRSTDRRIDSGGVTERMQAERQEMEKEKG